jgi:hypothetical protein
LFQISTSIVYEGPFQGWLIYVTELHVRGGRSISLLRNPTATAPLFVDVYDIVEVGTPSGIMFIHISIGLSVAAIET